MKKTAVILAVLMAMFCWSAAAIAQQSTIVEAEGFACMGDDKSKKETRDEAFVQAKREASERAGSHIWSKTSVKDYVTLEDLTQAVSKARIKILDTLSSSWYREPGLGDCYKCRIKAEVIPDLEAMRKEAANPAADRKKFLDDPTAPLTVKVWTDKKTYADGQFMKIYVKGNKPFYARVVYSDAAGGNLQILPNINRTSNYFNGGVIYEIPSGRDSFMLKVQKPYGKEKITVYAGTSPLGQLQLQDLGGVYRVDTRDKDIGTNTRGVALVQASGQSQDGVQGAPKDQAAVEFAETACEVTTTAQ